MKSILYLLFATLCSLSVSAQKTAKPMVMLRTEGSFYVYNTDGKLCWEDAPLLFHNPRGYVNGLLCGSELLAITDLKPVYHQCLYDAKGAIVWSPNLDMLPYNIITPPDSQGFALLENWETTERFVCDKSGKIVSPVAINLQYLGEGIVVTALPPDPERFDNQFFTFYDLTARKVLFETFAYSVYNMNEGIISMEIKESAGDNLHLKTYVSRIGETVVAPQNYAANELGDMPAYKDGLLFLTLKDSTFVLNKTGKNIFQKGIAAASYMGSGLIKTQKIKGGAFQIYKKNGQFFNQETYISVGNCNENGVFYAQKQDGFQLLDKEGKTAKSNMVYDSAFCNNTNFFMKKNDATYDVFTENGVKKGSFKANSLNSTAYGATTFTLDGKMGVLDKEGKVIIAPNYFEQIGLQEDYIFTVFKKENASTDYSFYTKQGKLLLKDIMNERKADLIIPVVPANIFISY